MSKAPAPHGKWNQRPSTTGVLGADALRTYFENSPDAIWLFDPSSGVFVDCNDAAVAMEWFLVRDGKIQRRWAARDALAQARQVGIRIQESPLRHATTHLQAH